MKTLKIILLVAFSFTLLNSLHAKPKGRGAVKNVIILIPDGTSTGLVTLARWYNDNPLAIDPFLCGMVQTYNSDGRFPDSAPTSTAYATGVKTRAPHVGIDSDGHPRASVLELAKLKGLSTGVVVTCEFAHATPADFVCHFNSRESGKYKNLAKQFIYNSPDLLFAGGEHYLDKTGYKDLLEPNGIKLINVNNTLEFNNLQPLAKPEKMWTLLPDRYGSTYNLSLECDRDKEKTPSLSEMTKKAIELLSKNKNGFFLMVEGSQIDWAAHANDPYAAVTEFIEFDKAVAEAIAFAKKDKNTAVIVCPDHGTGGLILGNQSSDGGFLYNNPNSYGSLVIKKSLADPLKDIQWTAGKLAWTIMDDTSYISKDSLKKYYNFSVDDDFIESLKAITEIKTKKDLTDTIQYFLGRNFSLQNFIGWSTTGHTAEDVFLAIYAPEHIQRITGVVNNDSIGRYIANILNLGDLNKKTDELFKKHTAFFNDNEIISLNSDSLVVRKDGRELTFEANSNILKIKGEKERRLPSIVVCIDGVYYLPEIK